MSTVVGDCQDCIVSLPAQPKTAMVYQVTVMECNNLVRSRSGRFDGNYPANNLSSAGVNIAAAGSYSLGAVSSLCIKTSQPLQVTLTVAGQAFTINVNQLLILDDAYDSVVIQNQGTETATVAVFSTV